MRDVDGCRGRLDCARLPLTVINGEEGGLSESIFDCFCVTEFTLIVSVFMTFQKTILIVVVFQKSIFVCYVFHRIFLDYFCECYYSEAKY